MNARTWLAGLASCLLTVVGLVGLTLAVNGHAVLASQETEGAPIPEPRSLTVLVGVGQDTASGSAFFPQSIHVRAGDMVTWRLNSDEPHAMAFLSGQPYPPIPVPVPGGGPGEAMFNPQIAFPSRLPGAPVETYSGTGFRGSGVLDKRAPPGAPLNDAFSLTFDTPGMYPYVSLFSRQIMQGLVIVEPAIATGLPSQADVDAQAQAEMAHMLARVDAARAQAQSVRREPGPNNTSILHVRAGARDEVEELGAEVLDFFPKDLTVRAGDTVVWGSTFFHTATFVPTPPIPDLFIERHQDAGPPMLLLNPLAFAPAKPAAVFDPAQHFNSGLIGPFGGGSFTWALTFERPGTFEYVCVFHHEFGMKGTVTVQAR